MGFAAIATAATAGSAVLGAVGQYKAAGEQAGQSAAQARAARVRAKEVEASRRDELQRTLSSFNAARGANSLSLTSPTARAVAGDIAQYARADYLAERRGIEQQALGYDGAARAAQRQGQLSLLTGAFRAAPSLLSLGQSVIR